MRLRPSPGLGEIGFKIDAAVEMKASVGVDVNIQRLEISWCVDESDIACLDKVIGDDDVFLVGRDLDIMWADGGLNLIWVVETLDVVQV